MVAGEKEDGGCGLTTTLRAQRRRRLKIFISVCVLNNDESTTDDDASPMIAPSATTGQAVSGVAGNLPFSGAENEKNRFVSFDPDRADVVRGKVVARVDEEKC